MKTTSEIQVALPTFWLFADFNDFADFADSAYSAYSADFAYSANSAEYADSAYSAKLFSEKCYSIYFALSYFLKIIFHLSRIKKCFGSISGMDGMG